MSSITRFLLDRSSETRLVSPAPAASDLELAFQAAARAPDHALLRPWRYLVVEGEGLDTLGELFAACCASDVSDQDREKARNAPRRAPMVIVGIASPKLHPKVPEIEQVMSAASGMMLMSLALNDAGFGAMWRTGPMAYEPLVQEALGLSEEEMVTGFLYTGTVERAKPEVPRPTTPEFVQRWVAPGHVEPFGA